MILRNITHILCNSYEASNLRHICSGNMRVLEHLVGPLYSPIGFIQISLRDNHSKVVKITSNKRNQQHKHATENFGGAQIKIVIQYMFYIFTNKLECVCVWPSWRKEEANCKDQFGLISEISSVESVISTFALKRPVKGFKMIYLLKWCHLEVWCCTFIYMDALWASILTGIGIPIINLRRSDDL